MESLLTRDFFAKLRFFGTIKKPIGKYGNSISQLKNNCSLPPESVWNCLNLTKTALVDRKPCCSGLFKKRCFSTVWSFEQKYEKCENILRKIWQHNGFLKRNEGIQRTFPKVSLKWLDITKFSSFAAKKREFLHLSFSYWPWKNSGTLST